MGVSKAEARPGRRLRSYADRDELFGKTYRIVTNGAGTRSTLTMAKEDGELGLGLEPLARRSFPLLVRVVQDQI